MNKKSVLVPEGTFRSKLTGIATALFAAAALAGVLSILCVFAPGGLLLFRETAAPEGIKTALVVLHGLLTDISVDEQVTLTFAILLGVSILFGTIFSAALSVGIFQMQRGKAAHGAQLIARGAKILFYTTTALGLGAAVLFAIRLVRYIIMYLSGGIDGLMLMMPGVATEILLGAIATLIILKLRRFFDSAGDCALSISRTLTAGILSAPTISMTPAVGCLLLGISGLLLALARISAISTQAAVPVLYFSGAMFLFGGAAGIVMFFYLRNFKRSSEYLLYKGTPATVEE